MKKLSLIGAAFAALIGPAMAADSTPRVYRRPMVVAAPVYTWTGFYVGGNVGYSWGDARTDIAGSATTISTPAPIIPGHIPGSAVFADSSITRLNGVIAGGQVGYNYQFSPNWVLGFETDIQGSGERGSNTLVDPFSTQICVEVHTTPPFRCALFAQANATAMTAHDARINWFGTVRGRLGFLITGQVLLYGTGGLAYGRVGLSGNTNANGSYMEPFVGTFPFAAPGASVFSASQTKVGLAVGGGMEGKCSVWLPAGWTWKLEYLYVDLGSLDTVSPFPAAQPGVFTTAFTGSMTTHTHFTDNIVRVGLNYKFGNYYAPVVTK